MVGRDLPNNAAPSFETASATEDKIDATRPELSKSTYIVTIVSPCGILKIYDVKATNASWVTCTHLLPSNSPLYHCNSVRAVEMIRI